METLKSLFKGIRRLPAQISDQLPVVEVALEDDQHRLGEVGVQLRVGALHRAEVVRVGPERVGMHRPPFVVDEASPASAEPIDASVAVVTLHDVTLAVAGNGVLGAVRQLGQDPVDVGRSGVGYEPGTLFDAQTNLGREAKSYEEV